MLHSNLKCTPGFIVLLISKVVVATTVSANVKLSTANQDQTSTNETLKPMSICNVLPCEAFLAFDKGSQPTIGQQITNMLPKVGRQTANSRPTVG